MSNPTLQEQAGDPQFAVASSRSWASTMTDGSPIYGAPDTVPNRLMALALFALWLGIVLFVTWNHVVFRDEVRALSLALQGSTLFSMFEGIHGEGHPVVWYLLLRGAHALTARPEVLQIVSITVASAAVLLLVLRSPFNWKLIAVVLAGHIALFEYSVIARNYGISMLLLFIFAAIYERHRDRGCLLGLVLFLLANCNAHSVLLVGALLLFWLVDIVTSDVVDRSQGFRILLFNAALAVLGVAFCLVTIFPTFNDAALIYRPDGVTLFKILLKGIFLPAAQFDSLIVPPALNVHFMQLLLSLIMFGSTLGLVRRLSAFFAALLALVGLSLFFALVYPGGYRHQALWLVFLISMYWLAASKRMQRESAFPACFKPLIPPLSKIGSMLFFLLLLLQVPAGILELGDAVCNMPPMSRSRDLGVLVKKHPELQRATIIADPDFLVEALPYYISNRTYLMREQRFGNVVHFTRKARLQLSLTDVLANARSLRLNTGEPVIILLTQRLDPFLSPQVYKEGYDWDLFTTPDQIRAFQSSTRLIKRFAPASTDESFDVYVLD